MKTIENLDLEVTYKIGLIDIEVSDEVYEQLEQIQDKRKCNLTFINENYPELYKWIITQGGISEDDAYDIEYNIYDMF